MKSVIPSVLLLLIAFSNQSARAEEFDVNTYLGKTFTASYRNIILDETKNSGMKKALGPSCVKQLQKIYQSNESLRSDLLIRTIRELKNFGIDSTFYHYTEAKEFNDILDSRTKDRQEAHTRALATKAYDKIFSFYRTKNLKNQLWGSVHFLAEDDRSSRHYGSIKTMLRLSPTCQVLKWDNSIEKEVMNEVVGRFKDLEKDCKTNDRFEYAMIHNNLHFIIAEDSGVDIMELSSTPQWFTLLTPRCIEQTEISQR